MKEVKESVRGEWEKGESEGEREMENRDLLKGVNTE